MSIPSVCSGPAKRVKNGGGTPKKFKSFMPSSDDEGPLHIFDSPLNRKKREEAFGRQGLAPVPASQLKALWEKHCEAPYPEDFTSVQAIGPDWNVRTKKMIYAAMPEYQNLNYTLSQCMAMEIIQHNFAVKAAQEAKKTLFYCVEGMSGMGNLSKGFQKLNMDALRLDRKYSSTCDFSKPQGVRNYIVALRSLDRRGVAWYGVECSSWVWVSRSGTHRSAENPEGNEENAKVREANLVRDGIVFLMLLLAESYRLFVVEQPCSSLLNASAPFEMALMVTDSRIVSFDHAAYEDEEPEYLHADEDEELPAEKSLKCMGNCAWLPLLERRCTKDVKRAKLCESTTDKSGKKKSVTGKSKELKSSEHYCPKFGDWVATCHLEHLKESHVEDALR